jgi:hypothetical protein
MNGCSAISYGADGAASGGGINPLTGTDPEIRWVQQFYFGPLAEVVADELSPPAAEATQEIEPDQYYGQIGQDGKGLRVPTDLDDLIWNISPIALGLVGPLRFQLLRRPAVMVQVDTAPDDDARHLVRTRPDAIASELNHPGIFPVQRADGVGAEMR